MNKTDGVPLIYGEVLFDHFETGESVLGGAPFNVAWHLAGFGLSPLFASRVGNDTDGQTVRSAMAERGMEARSLQMDSQYPTGSVSVTIRNDEPAYTINDQQAYDFIDPSELEQSIAGSAVSLVYHGSLIRRNPVSRSTLDRLIQQSGAGVFVDINLRPPWVDREDVKSCVQGATWLKLNEDEFGFITGNESARPDTLESRAAVFRQQYDLAMLVVTRAEHGAVMVTTDTCLVAEAPAVANFVDAVGAGDAFSAVMIAGLLENWSAATILERALAFAARVCEFRGALIQDDALYASAW